MTLYNVGFPQSEKAKNPQQETANFLEPSHGYPQCHFLLILLVQQFPEASCDSTGELSSMSHGRVAKKSYSIGPGTESLHNKCLTIR